MKVETRTSSSGMDTAHSLPSSARTWRLLLIIGALSIFVVIEVVELQQQDENYSFLSLPFFERSFKAQKMATAGYYHYNSVEQKEQEKSEDPMVKDFVDNIKEKVIDEPTISRHSTDSTDLPYTSIVESSLGAAVAMPNRSLLESILQKAWQSTTSTANNCIASNTTETCIQRFRNFIPGSVMSMMASTPSSRNTTNMASPVVTIATHGSVSRLDRLLIQDKWWGGPISAAIYINKRQDLDDLLQFSMAHWHELVPNITIHLLFENDPHAWYPYNMLRNLAVDTVKTDYVLTMDIDFITNPGAHERMVALLETDPDIANMLRFSKFMFALPPFDVAPQSGKRVATEELLPTSKEEVIERVQARNGTLIRQFYGATNVVSDNFHYYPWWYNSGNNDPSYAGTSSFYERPFLPGMEPYVLAYITRRHNNTPNTNNNSLTSSPIMLPPPYHEEFRGWGCDKESWFWRLGEIDGYKFGVLQNFFVMHLHHPRFPSMEDRKASITNAKIYIQYQEDLNRWKQDNMLRIKAGKTEITWQMWKQDEN